VQSFLPAPPSSTHARGNTADGRFRTASPSPAVNGTNDVDAKAIDSLLIEIVMVLGRWNLYIKFLSAKCQYDAPKLGIPRFLQIASLANKLSRIQTAFESLETFFFRRSVEKAFQLDEPTSQSGPPTTSVIDDVMFVLRKTLDRALGTGDADLLKKICANTRRILDLDFAGVLKRRFSTIDWNSKTRGTVRERIRGCVSELNNLDLSSESIKDLTQGYTGQDKNLNEVFPFEGQLETAQTALRNVASLKERFDSYLHVLPPSA
jgi:conserved oligomeric Golgi complex subunit 4